MQWWRKHAKSGGLKYLAPNINAYVLMIFTAFSLPPYSTSYDMGHDGIVYIL